ncbi:hypothetical protein KP509_34G011400 [Ceratopteris richardii]|uniref:RING-type domain-containing protein n=1 Tax=Ceratopteris richardii TaxID=49495 RepID=A0A8T2QJ17_CERRI|nr:hypothetical protein KP509_34G011400 [Ceratopteris richardii]
MRNRRIVTCSNIFKSIRALAAYLFLLCFTLLLIAKISSTTYLSWWWIFLPLWVSHGVVARGRFSLPAPMPPHDRHWAPCHSVIAAPLFVAFEVLLCTYLSIHTSTGDSILSMKIVFIPLLFLEAVILVDNFRMCRALMPREEESMSDDAIWETLPHFWVAVSMVFFVAGTTFTLLKLDVIHSLGWWDLFINFGIAEGFAFLVCTKWTNPTIHREEDRPVHQARQDSVGESSTISDDSRDEAEGLCSLENLGGHFLKILVIAFQVLLCMKLEGTPSQAKSMPLLLLFSPVLVIQGLAVIFSALKFMDNYMLLQSSRNNSTSRELFPYFNKIHAIFDFLDHGSRLLGWWSIDESCQEERSRLWEADTSGYETFSGLSPQVVKKMPKKDLAEEVWRLQEALKEQTEITKYQQDEFQRLQNEKVLCRVCFERDIGVVLLPCRHHVLCSFCSKKCKTCPLCRKSILERMPVYDV